jgi:hypothetical protein
MATLHQPNVISRMQDLQQAYEDRLDDTPQQSIAHMYKRLRSTLLWKRGGTGIPSAKSPDVESGIAPATNSSCASNISQSAPSRPAPQSPAPGPEQKLLAIARPSLFWTIKQKSDRNAPKKHVMSIAAMQAVVVQDLKLKIVAAGKKMLDGEITTTLPNLLEQYCQSSCHVSQALHTQTLIIPLGTAVRSLDFMQQRAGTSFNNNPFLIQTSSKIERDIMATHTLIPDLVNGLPPAVDEDHPQLYQSGLLLDVDMPRNWYHKLYLALAGGLSFIIPMIIMKFYPYRTSVLITTTVCVVGLSALLALRTDLRPGELFVMIAAYAAVLTVFVGTAASDRWADISELLKMGFRV